MNKEETIERYGEAAWEKHLAQCRAHNKAHKEEEKAYNKKYYEEHREEEEYREKKSARKKKYREEHPEQVKANNREQNRKGGKYYDKKLKDDQTGLRGERNRIRGKHGNQYRPYKKIIAPDSQIHHEWVPDTPEYRGLALVEKEQHMHGFVDVIEILDGEIKLLTEEEVRMGKNKKPKL